MIGIDYLVTVFFQKGNEEELGREDVLYLQVEEEVGGEDGRPFLDHEVEKEVGGEDGRCCMDLEVVEETRKEDVGKTSEEKAEPAEKVDTLEKEKGDEEDMEKGDAVAVEMGETEAMEKREEERVEAETMEKGDMGKTKEGETSETGAMNKKDKEDAVVNLKGKASANKGKASTKKRKASTNKRKASTNKGKESKKKEEEGITLGEGEASKARKRQRYVTQPAAKKLCTRQNTGPLPKWSKILSPDNPLNE